MTQGLGILEFGIPKLNFVSKKLLSIFIIRSQFIKKEQKCLKKLYFQVLVQL